MSDTPPLWLVVITLAVYCGFLVGFGEEILDVDLGSCTGLTSCAEFMWDAVVAFFALVTLGGFSSPLPVLLQLPLLLFFGIGWGPTVYGLVMKAVDAVIPG